MVPIWYDVQHGRLDFGFPKKAKTVQLLGIKVLVARSSRLLLWPRLADASERYRGPRFISK
jgi:hypothetical protein